MKNFEQFKVGYKAIQIELTEFSIEGMTSEEIIEIAQRYPNCVWYTCDNIQSESCGYTAIYRMETEEETLARAKVDYDKYVAREAEKVKIANQLKAAQSNLTQMEIQMEKTRQELVSLRKTQKRLEDEARGYALY